MYGQERQAVLSGRGKRLNQMWVDEELFPSGLHFAEEADVGELLQINRCRLSLSNAGIDDVGDAAVSLHEDQLGQLAGVDARRVTLHALGGVVDKRPDRLDARCRPPFGL